MARVINRKAGSILEKYESAVQGVDSQLTQGPVNKAWRARIITNRLLSGLPKEGSVTPNLSKTINNVVSGQIVSDLVSQVTGIKPGPSSAVKAVQRARDEAAMNAYGSEPIYRHNYTNRGLPTKREIKPSEISDVIRVDWKDSKEEWLAMYDQAVVTSNKVIIFNNNNSPYQYIELQNRPPQVQFQGESTWAVIKSMGRNTPMYHYVGAEEVIQMNISWYCNDPDNPGEVINKCRLLESWTKADGYTLAPPVLQIGWGSEGDLFYGRYFILTSATYILSNFNSGYRYRERTYGSVPFQNTYLLPYAATQELIFKRVSDHNLTRAEINTLGEGNRFTLKNTKGIVYNDKPTTYLRT